jgi:hypothetical protein
VKAARVIILGAGVASLLAAIIAPPLCAHGKDPCHLDV